MPSPKEPLPQQPGGAPAPAPATQGTTEEVARRVTHERKETGVKISTRHVSDEELPPAARADLAGRNVPSALVYTRDVRGEGEAIGTLNVPEHVAQAVTAGATARATAGGARRLPPEPIVASQPPESPRLPMMTGQEDLTAPLLGAGAGAAAASGTAPTAIGPLPRRRMSWLTTGYLDENNRPTRKGAATGAGLLLLLAAIAVGASYPFWPKPVPPDDRLDLEGGKNVTGYDGQITNPYNGTRITGPDQSGLLMLGYYLPYIAETANFTNYFASRSFVVDAANPSGNLTVPFSSLDQANSFFDNMQVLGAGTQTADIAYDLYGFDSQNRTTKRHALGAVHYIPGPAPIPPITISGAQNATIEGNQTYSPYPNFDVQNLGEDEANNAHLALAVEGNGQTSCEGTVNNKVVISANTGSSQAEATLNFAGQPDLKAAMQGMQVGCSGDNATVTSQVFVDTSTRNASNSLVSAGNYYVPPAPPVPADCDTVSVVKPNQVTTLSNKMFYPLSGVNFVSSNASRPIENITGAWGYCYSVQPTYNFFVDVGCDATNFPSSSIDSNYNRCCATESGVSYAIAQQRYTNAALELQSGVKMGQTREINGTFQSSETDCPTTNAGIMAQVTPTYLSQQEAGVSSTPFLRHRIGKVLDLERDALPV